MLDFLRDGPEVRRAEAEYGSMDLRSMLVDQSYQRSLSKRHVSSGFGVWDARLAGIIEVNIRRGGAGTAVLDGQHRKEKAIEAGVFWADCKIHRGLSLEEEASLFRDLNKHRLAMTASTHWKSGTVAHTPIILAASQVLAEFGYSVKAGSSTDPRVLSCFQTLEDMVAGPDLSVSPQRLREVFEFINEVWPEHKFGISKQMMEGVRYFLDAYSYSSRYSRERSVDKLGKVTPSMLQRFAAEFHSTSPKEFNTSAKSFSRAMAKVYDGKLSDPMRLYQGPTA